MNRYRLEPPEGLMVAIEANRLVGHRLTMALISNHGLSSTNPRQDAGMLWRIDDKSIIVQTNQKIASQHQDIKIKTLEPFPVDFSDSIEIYVAMEATYCKVTPYPEGFFEDNPNAKIRGKRVNVPDSMISSWAENKIKSIGLLPKRSLIAPISVKVGKRSVKGVEISGEFDVVDAEILRSGIENGVGRSKNYGFGLIDIKTKDGS